VTSYADAWVQPGYNLGIVWAAELRGAARGLNHPRFLFFWGGAISHFVYSLVNVNHSNFIYLSLWFESWLYINHLNANNEISRLETLYILRFEHIYNINNTS
jgi:hypothetical protein